MTLDHPLILLASVQVRCFQSAPNELTPSCAGEKICSMQLVLVPTELFFLF